MNGLEASYGDRAAFLRVNAASRDGQAAYRAYRLQGHPAFVLLTSGGDVFWTGLGEQPGEILERQLKALLVSP